LQWWWTVVRAVAVVVAVAVAVAVARVVARAVARAVVGGSSFLTNYQEVFILVKLSFLLLSPISNPTISFVMMCFFSYLLPLL
jgi:hypothetical protein